MVNVAKGNVAAPDLFIVLRPGSRLDASGASASLLANGAPVSAASAGGLIAISSANGLYLDGQMIARSGGAGAAGGRLALGLDTPEYKSSAIQDRVKAPRDVLSDKATAGLPAALDNPATAADKLAYGHATLGADQLEQGGFGALDLLSNGLLSFAGDVTLNLGQSLRLFSRTLAMTPDAAPTARVRLAAPYIMLAGATDGNSREGYQRPLPAPITSNRVSASALRAEAGLIDLRDNVTLGLAITHPASGPTRYTGLGFPMAELVSRGDIRILGGLGALNRDSSAVLTTQFATPGDLTLTAAQIYPETGAVVRVAAGVGGKRDGQPGFEAGSRLVIRRAADQLPDMPYSAFGTLRLAADIIEQGGVLRAPLGLLEIGEASTNGITSRVTLLPGSVTSVSGRGLTMPYGGTVDGVGYQWLGQDVRLTGQGGGEYHGSLSVGLQLAGQTVQVGDNALVDLSGGGQLLGAGFISGRGGSTDARFNPLVQTNPQGSFTLPGLSTNPVYALVPGAQPWPRRPRRTRARASRRSASRSPSAPACRACRPAHADAVHLRPDARRLPRRDQRRDARPGRRRRAAAAQRFLGHRRPPGQCLGRHRRRRAAPVTDHLGPAAAPVLAVQRNGLRRLRGGRRGAPWTTARAGAGRCPHAAPATGQGRAGRVLQLRRPGRFLGRPKAAGGTLAVASMNSWQDALEITAPGAGRSAGFNGLSLDSAQLNRLGAPRLMVGATPAVDYRNIGNVVYFGYGTTHFQSIALRAGASDGRRGVPGRRRALGQHRHRTRRIHQHRGTRRAGLRLVDRLHLQARPRQRGGGVQRLDQPAAARCRPAARRRGRHPHRRLRSRRLRGRGAALFGRHDRLRHQQGLRTGQRRPLRRALPDAGGRQRQCRQRAGAGRRGARGGLSSGLTLNQTLLDRLMAGDRQHGAPALEMLTLAVSDSFNFFNNVVLDTLDPATGKSRLRTLALTAPAIYGYGQAGDAATIRAGNLIWNGAVGAPAGVVNNGAGTGQGR